ncbi:guanine deaminase [Devosia sp. YIM 151766]|uniref:guanine deaminase n=1 Tax=Devosia sp. YIM 151766 TaxID=3017325 RepID=UPI00255C73DF|nr:guanine deaminase [Devosia sp. YIM 151766]WIY51902.1 guanine deaminase [Devosia sp. YIM 151766]
MSRTILRGRVLSFHRAPQGLDDADSYLYLEDGAVSIEDGSVVALGDFSAADISGAVVIDHRPNLILPGFIDLHLHYVQSQITAAYAGSLLEWLNTYTFIEEQKFSQQGHADAVAVDFYDALIRHGTTSAVAYCSSHPRSVDAFFAEAQRRNMLMVGGKVMMDRNAPAGLCDDAQSSYDDSKALIARWHGRGRGLYAISPRFAITSTPAQMEAARALVAEHPEAYVQTHLSENDAEISYSMELYPEAPDYTGIYEHYGLLGRKTLLGHCIHLNHRETGILAETGSVAVFCPTSNLFLGSGLFDRERLLNNGVRIGIATDIGGGTSFSMLRTLDEGYKVLQLQGQRLNPFASFHMATLGNAEALGLERTIGAIAPGRAADLVVLDARATPTMRMRMANAETLAEELFVLQTLGDDRAVAEVYVAGARAKSTLGGL